MYPFTKVPTPLEETPYLNRGAGIILVVSYLLKSKFHFINDAITIQTADTTDTTGDMFVGGLLFCAAAAVNTIAQLAADKNKLTFDDDVANSGGGPGTWCEVTCIADAKWFVRGIVEGDSDADGVGSAIGSDVD